MGAYKIGTAARLTGLEVATLRNWEKRYRVLVPHRNGTRQRLYSQEQLKQLRLLKRWVDAGLSAGEAHARLRLHLDRIAASDAGIARDEPRRSRVQHEPARERDRYATLGQDAAATRRRAVAVGRQAALIRKRATVNCRRADMLGSFARSIVAKQAGRRRDDIESASRR